MFGMEERSGHVIEMSSARVYLPSLGLAHSPYLDLSVVGCRNNQRESGMEGRKINTTIVTFQDVFDSGKVVEGVESPRRAVWGILAEAGNIPYAHSLILGR